MLTIAILEDNPVHSEQLKSLLCSVLEKEYSLFEFQDSAVFLELLKTEEMNFDIAFMDIELENSTGMDAADQASRLCPGLQIIFISQYLKYVSPVYETGHTYFIYKPELKLYLKPALEKALRALDREGKYVLDISWNRETFHIIQKDILYMERTLRTTNIYTSTSCYHTSKKLTELISLLDDSFVLCHRSFVVNLRYLSSYTASHLTLSNGKDIPVSRSHLSAVKEKLNELMLHF
ncbi:response regulator transcription factor [Mediterraneibacter glycyrrhizinilyticus]|uniref:LytR/AlgR family response regulator transcription factor n=1 Tax=Mediterraneibacter glycyrrhizinilyticus TaxID=342942 RepID=UPI00195FA969|nr:LytTR family DNA-binding domain-containing protein [Mediterraneibacter glycyrrhizinilyticus]MBM6752140.1 response regulator transcription factor [Mediterraneibacter glycyrrhizinilyticus]